MATDAGKLRRQLKDFRSRSTTIQEAVMRGEESVDVAIELLADRSEAVRWSALRILREVGSMRAVGAIIASMDLPGAAADAVTALRALTGQDFGDDVAAWRQWAAGEVGVDVPAMSSALSDEELVLRSIESLPAEVVSRKERRFQVKVSLPDGRSQRVYVDFGGHDAEDEPMVRIYTRCGQATEERYEWALKRNLRMPYGALAIADVEGTSYFVMFNTHLRATVDPEDIAKSVMTMAERGDHMEKRLSDTDRH